MIMHGDLKKSYPSKVAHKKIIIEYSIIMHQIIHSFEINTSWWLNLLTLLVLLKWLIHRNDHLTFSNKMDPKEILVISKHLYKSSEKCYFYYLGVFTIFLMSKIVWIMFKKIHGKFMYITSCSDSFHVRNIMALNGIFSIFPLAEIIKRMVYLKMSHWILK